MNKSTLHEQITDDMIMGIGITDEIIKKLSESHPFPIMQDGYFQLLDSVMAHMRYCLDNHRSICYVSGKTKPT